MAAMSSQSLLATGTTPTPISPTASDTIAQSQFGPNGCILRCITTGTPSNITVTDPNTTSLGNPGSASAVALVATGSKMIKIPTAAINQSTQVATVTSSSQTGLTYELYQY